MADNFLENQMEKWQSSHKTVIKRANPSLDTLLRRNRSYRGYDPARKVSREELRTLVETCTLVPSGMNRQPLRFRPVTAEEAGKVLPLIKLGAALPEEHLPKEGMQPEAFLVVCSAVEADRAVWIDLGIAAQSILLKAVEMGLNGIFVLNFKPEAVQEALALPMKPLAVIAVGKGAEEIFLKPVDAGEDLNYYRKNGVHFVPKRKVDDLIL